MRALPATLMISTRGCERLCERVAVALDGGLPQGERSHQVLLGRWGSLAVMGRPPVFSGSLLLDLDEYRRVPSSNPAHIWVTSLEAERS